MPDEANATRLPPFTLAALFLAAVVSHLSALANQFALDDDYILANPAIQSLRTVPAALASPWSVIPRW